MALTDVMIRNTKPGATPKRLRDGKGLYLEVRPSGARLWRYRYRIAGKENIFAAGEYVQAPAGETAKQTEARLSAGQLTLGEARNKRSEWRGLVKRGIHPAHARAVQKAEQLDAGANTFEAVARTWLAIKAKEWTPQRIKQATRWLERDVFSAIGSTPIRDVKPAMIIDIMERVARGEGRGRRPAPTVAIQVRQYCDAVFSYAKTKKKADDNPAAGLDGVVAKPPSKKWRPLSRARIGELIHALDVYVGDPATAIALQLMLLTFVRTGELRGAEWTEFDLDHGTWTIPAERMKMRDAHVVPLSEQAVALLVRLHAITGKRRYLFPNHKRPSTFLGKTTLNAALVRMGFEGELSPHGMRKIASTMLNELGFRSDVIERQLAHGERNQVRSAYNFAQYLPERTTMMQAWADQLDVLAKGDKKVIAGRFGKVA